MTTQSYKYDANSGVMSNTAFSGFDSSMLVKDVEVLGGSGEWKQYMGYKVFVDDAGVIINGPDPFIGFKISDLENLTMNQGLTVMHSIQRAMGTTNKSAEYEAMVTESEEGQLEKSEAFVQAREALERFVKENSVSRYRSTDPLDNIEG